MRAVIRNFRGVKTADLDLSGLALVCGTNAAGKSSIAQAVAAALAGEAVPIAGLKKSEAGALVHAGTGRGGISLEADGGSIAITYPQAKVKSEGTPPAASPFAVGLRSVVDMDPKAAAATLIEYLHATPTQEDLARAVERFLEPAQAEKLWHTVADLGWDGAYERAKQTGAKLKGAWEHVTGERYGTNKADSWMPQHWATDLDGTSEETLQAALTEAREFLEAAIATTAISDAEREQLQAQADSLPALEQAHAAAAAAVKYHAELVNERTRELAALPKPDGEEQPAACPHCGGALVIRGKTVEQYEPASKEENARRAAAIEAARAALADATKAEREARDRLWATDGDVKRARQAADRLAKLPAQQDTAADVDAARAQVTRAEQRLQAFRAKTEADQLHANIGRNQQVVEVLAPNGLRLWKLRESVRAFNASLAELCTAAGWGTVELADDLSAAYDGRAWPLLSESEKFRVRVVLQLRLAALDRSAAVVIDGADILTRAGRNGLFRLVGQLGRPALVCMSMNEPGAVPNLAAHGLGQSYWVEGGECRPLTASTNAANPT